MTKVSARWMGGLMRSFAAGVIAAAAAYLINLVIIEKAGNKGMVSFIPIVEEILKTVTAFCLGASVINAHSVFGAIEAGYEIREANSVRGVLGGISSFAAHGLLGVVTAAVWKLTNSLLLGIGASAMLHSIWNRAITGAYTRN